MDPNDIIEVYEVKKERRNQLIWILILDGGPHLNLLYSHCALILVRLWQVAFIFTLILFMTICNIICEIIKSDSGISYIPYKKYEVTEVQFLGFHYVQFLLLNF